MILDLVKLRASADMMARDADKMARDAELLIASAERLCGSDDVPVSPDARRTIEISSELFDALKARRWVGVSVDDVVNRLVMESLDGLVAKP